MTDADACRARPSETVLAADRTYRAVIEHAPDGILLTAPDGRIFTANPAACALLGRTEEELRAVGRAGVVVVTDAARRFFEERQRTGSVRGLLTMIRKDGTTLIAHAASTVFQSEGGETLTSTTFRDVTESERARRALEILADAGRVLATSLDLDETLKHLTDLVVPKLADVCTVDLVEPEGVRRAAVAHRDPTRVASFEQVRRRAVNPEASAGVDHVLRTGEPSCVYELSDDWLRTAVLDGAHFEEARALGVRSFVSVPLIARSVTIGALTIMSDGGVPPFGEADLSLVRALGERAASAIDNAHQLARAVEARRLRDEVLSVVAHDLRGPLNTIGLATQLLARTAPGPEVDTIALAVRRADMLIHDLTLAAKMEAGSLPLERRPESVASIVDEVSALNASLAKARSLRLVAAIEGEGDLTRATVDRHRVVQMLSNLLANAIKFTPKEGRVELRCRGDGEQIVFTVSDTGSGIEPGDLPHVFDRYWQGARAR
ncbi:MAG TPA: ATP-binding protein, partial [Labilithrix sp.]|nr:ATP-binding protein [Labilithrix sp.]